MLFFSFGTFSFVVTKILILRDSSQQARHGEKKRMGNVDMKKMDSTLRLHLGLAYRMIGEISFFAAARW